MQLIRWFVGTALVFFGRVAIWAGQTLFHIGTAVMPNDGRKVRQHGSVARRAVLLPVWVKTLDGKTVRAYVHAEERRTK